MRRAELRRFGLVVGAVFLAIGGWWFYRAKFAVAAGSFVAIGATLLLLGAALPALLERPYRAWMAMAEGMAFVMTRIILAIVFYFVVTPIGFVMRLFGLDPLRRRAAKSDSYWHDVSERQRDPRHFEKMY